MAYLGREAAKAPIVTSDLPNDGVTLAKMAGGTDGQVITYDASGDPVAVGPGTDGQVLTSTGAGSPPAFEAAAGGGDLSFGGDTFGADKTIGSNDNYALSLETNNTERIKFTNDGRGLSQFTAKVWTNFSGTDLVTGSSLATGERDSHNVSSFIDHGTGDWTVTFSNAMANVNYVALVTATNTGVGDFQDLDALVLATGSIRIHTGYVSDTASTMSVHNVNIVGLVIFGD